MNYSIYEYYWPERPQPRPDALILNAAAEAGCELLLSEDMASGFAWRGTVVVNPFAPSPGERLARLAACGDNPHAPDQVERRRSHRAQLGQNCLSGEPVST